VNTRRMITRTDLDNFLADLLGSGTVVIGPTRSEYQGREVIEYARVSNPAQVLLDGPQPVRPLKEVFFPPSEILFKWKQAKSAIQIEETPTAFKEMVIVGARPCDAAALEIVDRVMGWDFRDEFWFGRRQAATVLSIACSQCDESCFCTAVSLSPSSTRGADWFLMPAEGGGFEFEVLTEKGNSLLESRKIRHSEQSGQASTRVSTTEEKVRTNLAIDPGKISRWLQMNFDNPLWKRISLRCHGCGACAFVCPACHCFDIVDEPEGIDRGQRRRNWDACQTALFTLHGSGHNPRRDQEARFRQRIMHKFHIYPQRFGEVLCTGCGRCIRSCPAGMDLIAILAEISQMMEEAGSTL
jgi:ferredoxin